MGDWLGTGTIAPQLRKYRPFKQARKYARSLNLKNGKEWKEHTKSSGFPDDIPVAPPSVYRDKGWIGWGDWLGTGYIAVFRRKYRSFTKARKYARSLNLKNREEWNRYGNEHGFPYYIPATPAWVYKDKGWAGWGDFLGTGNVSFILKRFRPFEEAREYARSLNITTSAQWIEHTKTSGFPGDIPVTPSRTYKNKGWVGMGDWLGTGEVYVYDGRRYRPFEDAREYARSLGLKSEKEWVRRARRSDFPRGIPARPHYHYRDRGWISWGDWLGTGNIVTYKRRFLSFRKAREYARSLNLKSGEEWIRHTKRSDFPKDIPVAPRVIYKDKGWKNMPDFLGYKPGRIGMKRKFRSFEKARKYARSMGFKNQKEWNEHTKLSGFPDDIPVVPPSVYRDKGWIGWGDWLGTGYIAVFRRKYRSFTKARKYARSLNLKNGKEWKRHAKLTGLPSDIPVTPRSVYRDKGWIGLGDWLGTGRRRR